MRQIQEQRQAEVAAMIESRLFECSGFGTLLLDHEISMHDDHQLYGSTVPKAGIGIGCSLPGAATTSHGSVSHGSIIGWSEFKSSDKDSDKEILCSVCERPLSVNAGDAVGSLVCYDCAGDIIAKNTGGAFIQAYQRYRGGVNEAAATAGTPNAVVDVYNLKGERAILL